MASFNVGRRSFLKGHRSVGEVAVRMPWAVAAFADVCRRCDDCIEACEEAIVVAGDGGYPTIDFQRGACTFCGACVAACEHDALINEEGEASPWSLKAVIDDACLSIQGITCRSCGESCDTRAIRFRLAVGGRAIPGIDVSLCNGCGSCIATCPIHVIQIQEAA